VRVLQTVPLLRIFDVAKACEFYVEYLGFRVDWEHRFEPTAPLYMQVSRDSSTGYRYMRPAVERAPWNAKVMEVVDPFGNRLRFNEDLPPAPAITPA
jgi:catechol 2,3-dioxygenase-like lactoylglutathione lyase family enzyme